MNFFCFLFFGLGRALFSRPSVHPCDQTLNGLGYCLFLCKHNLLSSDLFQTLVTDYLTWIPLIPIILLRLSLIFMIPFPLLFCNSISNLLVWCFLIISIVTSSVSTSTSISSSVASSALNMRMLVCSLLSYSSYLLLHVTM